MRPSGDGSAGQPAYGLESKGPVPGNGLESGLIALDKKGDIPNPPYVYGRTG